MNESDFLNLLSPLLPAIDAATAASKETSSSTRPPPPHNSADSDSDEVCIGLFDDEEDQEIADSTAVDPTTSTTTTTATMQIESTSATTPAVESVGGDGVGHGGESEVVADSMWTCEVCTLLNPPHVYDCSVCTSARPASTMAAGLPPAPAMGSDRRPVAMPVGWWCGACTFINSLEQSR